MERHSFVVEGAGCSSCAARLRVALTDVVRVEGVEIDDGADTAFVRVSGDAVSERRVEAAIAAASEGSGHTYRIKKANDDVDEPDEDEPDEDAPQTEAA